MADWYCSSAAYAAIAAFIPSHTYAIGDICKPTAPAPKALWVFRCTTAGAATTEPSWPTGNNSTITSGAATFTNVTGQGTYGWSAATGDFPTLVLTGPRFAGGDRVFVASDHSETQTGSSTYGGGNGTLSYATGQVLSVNRAGSVPPVAADLTAGATCTVSVSTMFIDTPFPVYHYGMNYVCSGASGIFFNTSAYKSNYFDTCQLYLNVANTNTIMGSGAPSTVILYNTTLRFGHIGQRVSNSTGGLEIVWLNTASAIAGATIPTVLFSPAANNVTMLVTARGVDLSAITGTLALTSSAGAKYMFDSCRIASAVTRYDRTSVVNTRDVVELVNCYDGTNFISESHQPSGAVTTEFTITLSGGATDNVGTFSHKLVSTANVDKYAQPLTGFWMDANYATTGSAKTATVEIVSSASLNNDEISLLLEYEGTASSSVASMATTLPATVLTAASAVTSSSATWNSLPATPVRQHLQVTFTPRTAGRVRGQVRLGKASTTVYYDPRITIS